MGSFRALDSLFLTCHADFIHFNKPNKTQNLNLTTIKQDHCTCRTPRSTMTVALSLIIELQILSVQVL